MKKVGKIIVVLLILMLLFATFAACNTDSGSNGDDNGNGVIDVEDETKTPEIKLSATSVNLTLGDTYVLTVSYVNTQKDASKPLTFSSSNTAAVKVDNNGNIEAYGKGAATVTASYDSLTATCNFTVDDSGIAPTLEFEGEVQNPYRIIAGSSFDLVPYIAFNNIDYDDGTFEYDVKDEDVLEVSAEGVVTSKIKGETEIEVTAQWRGYTGDTLKQTVFVEVDNDVRFSVNGQEYPPDISIYTVDTSANSSLPTEEEFIFSAMVNGTLVESDEIDLVITDTDIAVYEDGKIVSAGFGTTKGELSYTIGGEVYAAEFNITVTRPTVTIATPINYFSATKGMQRDETKSDWESVAIFDLFKIDLDTSLAIVDAKQGSTDLEVGEHGEIFGVTGKLHEVDNVAITVGSSLVIYDITLKVYGDIIATAADLDKFNRGKFTSPLTGYFIMVNNIALAAGYDAKSPINITDANLDHFAVSNKNYFKGTFDGNGYSITNYKDTANGTNTAIGLFGTIADGSVIKNFYLSASAVPMGRLLAIAVGKNVTIENVYLKVEQSSSKAPLGAIGRTVGSSLTLNNVVIDMPTTAEWTQAKAEQLRDLPGSSEAPGGLLFGGNLVDWTSNTNTISNVYVFGNFPIVIGYIASGYGYAANEAASDWPYEFGTGAGAAHQLAGVKRYNTTLAMTADAANNDLESFDNEYWGVENGLPVWDTTKYGYTIIVDGTVVASGSSFDAEINEEYTVLLKQFANITDFTLEASEPSAVTIDNEAKTFTLTEDYTRVTIAVKIGDEEIGNFIIGFTRASVTVDGDADFSIFHGKVISTQNSTWFGDEDYEVLEASLNGVQLTVDAGKITGINSSYKRTGGYDNDPIVSPANVGKLTGDLVIKTDEKIVTFKSVYAYDGVIVNGEQFKDIFDLDTENKVIDGFYVLGANIDMTGITLNHEHMDINQKAWWVYSSAGDTTGFHGIFDGRGYTISNFKAEKGGLFGKFYFGANNNNGNDAGHGRGHIQVAVVRNVAVTNVDASNGSVFAWSVAAYQYNSLNVNYLTEICNIYVSYSSSCTAVRGLIAHFRTAIKMSNIIVDASAVPAGVVSNAARLSAGYSVEDESIFLNNGTLFGSTGNIDNTIKHNTRSASTGDVALKATNYSDNFFRNIYVISRQDLILGNGSATNGDTTYSFYNKAYARNKKFGSVSSAEATVTQEQVHGDLANFAVYIFRQVYQYSTVAAMLADAEYPFNDTAFSSDYWTVDGTTSISWKGRS